MAEAVLFTLAKDILTSLGTEMVKPGGSFASQKIQLLCCAKDELQGLEVTVNTIQAVLLDAERQQWDKDHVKFWLKKLKDVLYDVQDLLDDVATEDLRRKVTPGSKILKEVCLFFSKSNQLAHCLRVGNEIQGLRKKLDQIEKIKNFPLEEHRCEATLPTESRSPTFEREENIIGREKDKEEIITHLLNSSSGDSVSIVSILGIGGMGKTTLANMVYRDEKVKECFKLRMWVCHGDPKIFNADLIVKKILNSAKANLEVEKNLEDIESKSLEELKWLLREVLDGKKYLLVLDDLWNENRMRWLELQPLLMGGSRGSKILITTRSSSVMDATENSVKFDLRGLSAEKSWKLFQKMAFKDGETSSDSGLEEIGRDLVKKCVGVPLAIKTIGSLLYTKNKTEWFNFKERELSNIDDSREGIMKVLKLSYDHLPSYLKHCFAYCALFPKDYVFDKQTMIQLWMAQGFIESSEESDDLEEIGDNYVSNLLCRSFLEVEEIDEDIGEVNTFKMHDLMHDLALKVAGDECKMIDLNEGGIIRGIRHASFASQSSSRQKVTSLLEATNLRTFLSLKEWFKLEPNYFPNEHRKIISKFRYCRALGFCSEDFLIPASLGSRLKHLRFLDISGNLYIQNLPDSITDLVNLQTLKLSHCEELTTLPRDLKKLVNLKFLDISGNLSIQNLPDSITDLVNLQTLKFSSCWKLTTLPRDLKKLVKLKFLDISRNSSIQNLPDSITDLVNLQTLKLYGYEKLTTFPRDLKKLVNLKFLDISRSSSIQNLPDSITDLVNLQTLKLYDCKKLTTFPRDLKKLVNLKFLDISSNSSIQNLPDSITDLVNLQTLKLSYCWKLTTLPRDLKKLVNLKHLLIDGCDSLSHMPCGLNNLSKLQTLHLFILQKMDHKVPDGVGSLDELASLNRLAGSIALKNLQFLHPVPNEGHLKEKQGLRCLKLSWSAEQQDGKSDSDELSLWENLRPHPNLTHLTIHSCLNRSPPSWLSSITNLIELKLDSCREWKYLPSLRELTSLRRLTLNDLDALEFVEEISDLEQSNTAPPYLPSLKQLDLLQCQNLKGWWGRRQPMEPDQDHRRYSSYSSFPKLLFVEISKCPHLSSMPLFPQIETLTLRWDSLKWLQQGMTVSTFIPFSKLEELWFQGVDLEHSMLETLLPFLRNLKSLSFDSCDKLRSLSRGMQSLSSLQCLNIYSCKELDVSSHDDEHGTQWCSLAKLCSLIFFALPELVALPEGIQHITTLESLDVSWCENLTSLPEWIGNFSSLQSLDVSGCSRLMCLPDGINRLTSLNTLYITECPVLQERCQRVSGADWEKIARLPCSRGGIKVER